MPTSWQTRECEAAEFGPSARTRGEAFAHRPGHFASEPSANASPLHFDRLVQLRQVGDQPLLPQRVGEGMGRGRLAVHAEEPCGS